MSDLHNKAEIISALQTTGTAITESISTMPSEQFFSGTRAEWSPADYLKHLILSVKPFSKGLTLPQEQLAERFGKSDGKSKSYARLVAIYEAGLARGIRAEDTPVVPTNYRMPEGVENEQTYLMETWQNAIQSLVTNLDQWEEEDLDQYQIPHPALGIITLREMLFFTVHHNQMHYGDIIKVRN